MKFELSVNASIQNIEECEDDIPEKFQQHYVLHDKRKHRDYVINGSIKYFLEKFVKPKTEAEVIAEIKAELNTESSAVDETCSSFFNLICKRKFIVPEGQQEIAAAKDALFKTGDTVANFTIQELISSRNCIDIYKACNKIDDKIYVLKLLNRNKTSGERHYNSQLIELEREFDLLKKVQHEPCVYKVYDLVKSNDEYAFLSLEYIKGKSLSGFLDDNGVMSFEDSVIVMENMLTAFSQLHRNNIIHGDIHSSNVLIDENKTVTVIDLGYSKKIDLEKDEVVKFGGVNFYMPPERINSTSFGKYAKEPDLFSDVYQVGLLLYLTLYNDLPFDGFIWEELAYNIKESPVAYPEAAFGNQENLSGLNTVIDKCLHKNPYERFNNALEILEAFKECFSLQTETVITDYAKDYRTAAEA